jgi:hypothetical protein
MGALNVRLRERERGYGEEGEKVNIYLGSRVYGNNGCMACS